MLLLDYEDAFNIVFIVKKENVTEYEKRMTAIIIPDTERYIY